MYIYVMLLFVPRARTILNFDSLALCISDECFLLIPQSDTPTRGYLSRRRGFVIQRQFSLLNILGTIRVGLYDSKFEQGIFQPSDVSVNAQSTAPIQVDHK